MKCPKCGEEIANDSKFCEFCGAKIKKKSKLPWWAILLIVLVWPIVIGLGVLIGISLPDISTAENDAEIVPVEIGEVECEPIASTEDVPSVEENKTIKQAAAEAEKRWVDLGLPSGTLWKAKNESGFYDYDAAVRTFGGKLPDKSLWEELKNVCSWSWTGSGYKVTGPNGNSIVLPAAGYRGCDGGVDWVGFYGYYWSSTPDGSDYARTLYFIPSKVVMNNVSRCAGLSVRLVNHQ